MMETNVLIEQECECIRKGGSRTEFCSSVTVTKILFVVF